MMAARRVRTYRVFAGIGTVLAATLATGCHRAVIPSSPVSSVHAASASSTVPPFAGAPKVPSPLPESALSGDPCEALTLPQVTDALGRKVTQKRDDISGIGPNCFWSADSGATVAVTLDTEPQHGLSGLYANVRPKPGEKNPKAEVWKELPPIHGFPAVASVTRSGGKPDRYCNISVGLLDTATVDVGLFLGDSKIGTVDPCVPGARVADAAVTTIAGKAGR
ncbi:hypothetical protein HUW46_09356 [Amycolatopsis sp. CA-230715]|nr:hypothetical protein HUW46_09356 [Amycolatopsis sp. CA-230715]